MFYTDEEVEENGINNRDAEAEAAENENTASQTEDASCVSVVLSEAEFADRSAFMKAAKDLAAETDRSHELVRPKISVLRALVNILLPIAIAVSLFCALYFCLENHRLAIALSLSLGFLLLYIIIRMRSILVWCIKVYQAVAPEHVRRRCVFTPTCSEYAIESLERFGVLRGVGLIWKRLKRCHHPNSGFDPVPEKHQNKTRKD